MSSNKDLVINTLKELVREYKTHPKDTQDRFRAIAYENSINLIKKIPGDLTLDNLKDIDLTDKTRKKVEEILTTKGLKKLVQIKKERYNPVYDLFIGIHGVGDKTANEWIKKGYKTISDLLKSHKKSPFLTHNQLIGIKYYDELHKKIKRSYIEKLDSVLQVMFKCINDQTGTKYKGIIAGSYRRGEETSNDIDILITEENGKINRDLIIGILYKQNLLTDDLSYGDKKYMGIVQLYSNHSRIDIEWTEPDEWAYSLLYFTGPKNLNIHMRNIASKKDLVLNEKGLFNKDGIRVSPKTKDEGRAMTEMDIFKLLNKNYLTPQERGLLYRSL